MGETIEIGQPPQKLLEVLARELEQGEELVWTGTPDPRTFMRVQSGARMLAWLFLGITIFTIIVGSIMSVVTHTKSMGIFIAVGSVPTLAISIGAVVKTTNALKKRAANTMYGLTAQRAIVIEGGMWNESRSVFSYRADQLRKMSKKEFPDGTGDLVFEEVSAGYSQNEQPVLRPRGFLGIADVHGVEGMVRSTLRIE